MERINNSKSFNNFMAKTILKDIKVFSRVSYYIYEDLMKKIKLHYSYFNLGDIQRFNDR